MIYRSANKTKVNEIAKDIAHTLKNGSVLLLQGNLGTGKTFFTSKICNHLNVKDLVNSPSYILLNEYEGKHRIFHYDLYRLTSPEEALELGILDRLNEGITIIEWPELVKDYMPKDSLCIHFTHNGKFRDINVISP